MQQHVIKSFGFLKTLAIGGLVFLLPLIVVGALVGQVVPIVMSVAMMIWNYLPGQMHDTKGVSLAIFLAIAFIAFLCFAAGLFARRSFGRKISKFIEKNVLLFFPRYAIVREQMAGSIGGDAAKPTLKPIRLTFDQTSRIAFEVERTPQGQVTVYLPGSPDPWVGSVMFVAADRVEPLGVEFSDAIATFEQLGRGSAALLAVHAATNKNASPDVNR